MKKPAQELTEQEKNMFAKEFYELWDIETMGEYDTESTLPWGCPWVHGSHIELDGEILYEMVLNYFNSVKDEIKALYIEANNYEEDIFEGEFNEYMGGY